MKLFEDNPNKEFRFAEVVEKLPKVKFPTIQYWLTKLVSDEDLVKPRQNAYVLNRSRYRTLDHQREVALALGQQRITQTPGVNFHPGSQVITDITPLPEADTATVTAPVTSGPHAKMRKDFVMSIVDRMKSLPTFTRHDIGFIEKELGIEEKDDDA